MKKMKEMRFKLGRVLVLVALAALPFAGCKKDEETEEQKPSQPQKHNVELVYGKDSSTDWQNISLDTIQKYNADPYVDTIFMVPQMTNQFSTSYTTGLQNRITKLRERHNVNPDKVFGKGELQLWNQSVLGHPEIVRFFADTLRYTVTYRETASKTR